jgi:peptidoglycan/xylan/chitin deacetylase (PgdA/CDA1 family)
MIPGFIKAAKRIGRRVVGRPILGRSILVYHRVAKDDFDPWQITVSPDEFERQLVKLRSKLVLPLREFVHLHVGNKLPRNAVAITFDDGYACNALTAAPMLESFGYSATFFVVSDAIQQPQEFWWDQLGYLFHAPGFDYEAAMNVVAPSLKEAHNRATRRNGDFHSRFITLWRLLRELPPESRWQSLRFIRDRMGIEGNMRSTHRPMTVAELQALAGNSLFEVGGHTATHPSLPLLDPSEQEREIARSRRVLESILGQRLHSFAYPYGDCAPATVDIVRRAGFECAVTNVYRRVRARDDRFELPRRHAQPPI